MIEARYVCYFCQGSYFASEHSCYRECHVSLKGVLHYDFCRMCRRIIIQSALRQFGLPYEKK